jgi:hypothetical protein
MCCLLQLRSISASHDCTAQSYVAAVAARRGIPPLRRSRTIAATQPAYLCRIMKFHPRAAGQNFKTTVAPIGVTKSLMADTGSSCAETPRLNQCSNARRPSLLFCRGPKCGLCVQAANRTMLVNRVGARDAQRHGATQSRPAIYDSGRQSARDYGCRQRAGAG